jgi:hypothetical protein
VPGRAFEPGLDELASQMRRKQCALVYVGAAQLAVWALQSAPANPSALQGSCSASHEVTTASTGETRAIPSRAHEETRTINSGCRFTIAELFNLTME